VWYAMVCMYGGTVCGVSMYVCDVVSVWDVHICVYMCLWFVCVCVCDVWNGISGCWG
jgi:hypothetical protein